jgi:hypothetical protein
LSAIGDEEPIVERSPPNYSRPTPPVFLRETLLLAVREGFEQIALRAGEVEGWYDMVGRCRGEEFGILGPTREAAQEFPAILADLGQPASVIDRPRPFGLNDASESGEFVLQVGLSSIRGTYRVRWKQSVVEELEIAVPLANEDVVEAASRDLSASIQGRIVDPTESKE